MSTEMKPFEVDDNGFININKSGTFIVSTCVTFSDTEESISAEETLQIESGASVSCIIHRPDHETKTVSFPVSATRKAYKTLKNRFGKKNGSS
jgi:hypothetical protein